MLRDLINLCERHGDLEPDELRATATSLLDRQFLLLDRRKDRDVYRIVSNHFDYFKNLIDALGWMLHRDDDFGIIGVLPQGAEAFARLKLVDSLLILCLRLLYEEGMEKYEVHEGRVYAEAEELLSRYEILLSRVRPQVTEFRSILSRLRRYSLIEMDDDVDSELPRIVILPSIRLVTGEQVQQRLAALAEGCLGENETDDDEDVSDQ